MITLVAGFLILAVSIAGAATLIASAVIAFFENARPAWRYRTATKVAASLSICYGSNLFLYCAEAAPSLLYGSPIYGHTFHIAAGWVAIAAHYGSILHLFSLSVLKIDILYENDSKRYNAPCLSNLMLIVIWVAAGGLSILVIGRACTYIFSMDYMIYRCDSSADSTRLVIVNVTLSGVFLLLSAVLIAYHYFAGANERIQNAERNQGYHRDLMTLRKGWSTLMATQLALAGSKLIIVTIATVLVEQMHSWQGLAVTVLSILLETLALWMYFRCMTRSLQIYVRIEEAKRQNRSVSFARLRRSRRCHSRGSVGSRHSHRGSSRRSLPYVGSPGDVSRRNNRIAPLDVETLERAEVVIGPPGPPHSYRTSVDAADDNEGEPMSRRWTVPVVQVQVYRSFEQDVDSLCNYCSDSESDSLKERSARPVNIVEPCTPTTPLSMSPPEFRNTNGFFQSESVRGAVHLPPIEGVAAAEQLPLSMPC